MKKFLLFVFLFAAPAGAVTIETPLADAAQEHTAHGLFRELKCVVCEGQALAESDATLARQMRAEIREMVAAGKSEQEILDAFVVRYGTQVLLDPPMTSSTWLLWFAPVMLVVAGVIVLRRVVK